MKGKRILPRKHFRKPEAITEPTGEQLQQEISDLAAAEAGQIAAAEPAIRLPSIAIVGRPNVGKSSLFNAILKRRQAIVHFDSGVTRDRVAASGVFNQYRFNLIDTGGLGMYSGEKKGVGFWDQMIAKQVEAAIESADALIFTVDVQAGLNPLDREIATRIRTCGKPVIVAANKADNEQDVFHADEFHSLGFEEICPVSCLHRRGLGDLMEAVMSKIPHVTAAAEKQRLRIAILGRPNVGKSSLVNRMLGEDRVIVSDVPGTTRDAVDVEFTLKCQDELVPALLVDTAGLRKRSKVDEAVEQYSMMRAEEALNSCDIVLFVLEASKGEATSQDKTIARMIEDSGKGCIIVCNKWDIRLDEKKAAEILSEIRYTLPRMQYAPVVFTSAFTGYNMTALYDAIAQIRAQLGMKVSTSMLNRVIQDAVTRNLPPVIGIKPLKVYYGTMVGMTPPRVVLFVNDPALCADTYKTYLTNYFRKSFGFTGFPIRIKLEERSRRDLSEVVNHAGSKHKKVANAKQYKEKKAQDRARKIEKRRQNSQAASGRIVEDDNNEWDD